MGSLSIIFGHYGCGKTNLSLNLAFDAAKRGEKVTIADMDIVNPYFRTTDYADALTDRGIRVIKPSLAGSTVDAPSLSSEIYSAFETDGTVIIDVGGDDAGAGALGRFCEKINAIEKKEILYVVNRFRPATAKPEDAVQILREIEKACKLKADAIVNNSHLCTLTEPEDILKGYEYALKVSELSGLPLKMTTVNESLYKELMGKIPDIYRVQTYVKLPF